MVSRKRFSDLALGAVIVFATQLSCQLSARNGQLSCEENPCPHDMYCHPLDQRCYFSDYVPLVDRDASMPDGGDIDTESDIQEDLCPDDPTKTEPGICGCGESDRDSDKDGTANCVDECPTDPDKTVPELCGCGYLETTCSKECQEAAEREVIVLDCGESREIESILFASYGDPAGSCETEPAKGDCHSAKTVEKIQKACLGKSSCNVRVDNRNLGAPLCPVGTIKHLIVEYFCREVDSCPNDPDKLSPGICGCGKKDLDSDGDDVYDCADDCANDPNKVEPGKCGCGEPDIDSDGDRTLDCDDACPSDPDKTEKGVCGCGTPDIDTDGDGAFDCQDICINDPNKVAAGIFGQALR